MRPGPLIRRAFGPYEAAAAEAYRRAFVDLDDFVERLRNWAPASRRILEVGCGEGAIAERLAKAYPAAAITGSDISPTVGRLFRGNRGQVRFLGAPVQQIATAEPRDFDLVIMCDVLHHVPPSEREGLLRAVAQTMAPGACFVLKDWIPSRAPIHWLCSFADRYLTGDAVVFSPKSTIAGLLSQVFGAAAIRAEASIRPWSNNVAFLVVP
ncbi:MAG TPA: class I SAM-dependent methyltransferase [Stellaceae bacterium]